MVLSSDVHVCEVYRPDRRTSSVFYVNKLLRLVEAAIIRKKRRGSIWISYNNAGWYLVWKDNCFIHGNCDPPDGSHLFEHWSMERFCFWFGGHRYELCFRSTQFQTVWAFASGPFAILRRNISSNISREASSIYLRLRYPWPICNSFSFFRRRHHLFYGHYTKIYDRIRPHVVFC